MEVRPNHLAEVLAALLHTSHKLEPSDLPRAAAEAAARLGADGARILLADYEQQVLRELGPLGDGAARSSSIEGTVAGRVYRTIEPATLGEEATGTLLLPLLDGTHRLGVLELSLGAGATLPLEDWLAFSALVADLVVTKAAYSDVIDSTRRTEPMAVRAEAQRTLLPPLTLMTPRVLITGILVPSYSVAGDAFDYALNGDTLHLAILDAMGHSMSATLTATVAIAAYRSTRRAGGDLLDSWRAADSAVAVEFGGDRFATALFAELDVLDGTLRSVSAGHPAALVARDNRVVARCADEPTLPLGLCGEPPGVTTTSLQTGDRLLLFTDGVVEARSSGGDFFGEDRLVDGISRELHSGLPPPEALRRLVHAVADHQDGNLRDDATMVLAEWRGEVDALLPSAG